MASSSASGRGMRDGALRSMSQDWNGETAAAETEEREEASEESRREEVEELVAELDSVDLYASEAIFLARVRGSVLALQGCGGNESVDVWKANSSPIQLTQVILGFSPDSSAPVPPSPVQSRDPEFSAVVGGLS